MIRMNIKSFVLAALVSCSAASTFQTVAAQDGQKDQSAVLLKSAWQEYAYREFSKAEKLFIRAEKEAKNSDEIVQALTGQAFCYHFGKRQRVSIDDYSQALSIYKRALEKRSDDPKFTPFFKAMSAECNYNIFKLGGDASYQEEAEKIWAELKEKYPDSIFTQDALLFKSVMATNDLKSDEAKAATAELKEYLNGKTGAFKAEKGTINASAKSPDDKTLLAPCMAKYIFTVLYWRGDYKDSVTWLKEYVKLGPSSISYLTTGYFRIAQTSEKQVGDKVTAQQFYRKLYTEYPNDRRAYYCTLKDESLGKDIAEGKK